MYTQNNNPSQQDELSLSIEQPDKQIWWEKKGFIAASIFSVIWLAFIWDFMFASGWWGTRHTLSPAEFIGGICGLFFPILLSFMISSYFDRTNQISYEAQTIRSYLNELIYPTNSNAVYTNSLTKTLKEQVKEFKKVHQDVRDITKNLDKELTSWIDDLLLAAKQAEDATIQNLKSLSESIEKLNKYSVEAGAKVIKSADAFNTQTVFLKQAVKEAEQSFTPIMSSLNQYGGDLKKIEAALQKTDEKTNIIISNTKKSADEIALKIKEIETVLKTYNEQAAKHDFVLKNRLEQTQSILDLQNQSIQNSETVMNNQKTLVEQLKIGIQEQTSAFENSENTFKNHQKNVEKAFSKTSEHIKTIEETVQKNYDSILTKSEEALSKIKAFNEEMKEIKTLSQLANSPQNEPVNENKTVKAPVDFLQNASSILDKLQTFSIDMAHIFTPKAEDMLWKKYYEGDKAVFMRYITRMINETQHKQIKDLYLNNIEFQQAITRYMTEFEDMTKMVQNEDDNKLLMSILIGSDIGRLYMVLADVLRRDAS